MNYEPFTPEWFEDEFARTGAKRADLVRFIQSKNLNFDASKLSKSISRNLEKRRELTPNEKAYAWVFFGYELDDLYSKYYNNNVNATFMMHSLEQEDKRVIPDFSSFEDRDLDRRKRFVDPSYPMPNAGLPETYKVGISTMPILGISVGGTDKQIHTMFNGQVLGNVLRPATLADNPRAYATYVHGTSMEPRYEAGEIVLVNPDKGYRKGCYVVAQVFENENLPPFGYIKKFISFNDELVLEQLNPPENEDRIMRFPRERVVAVHRIVGTLDE